MTTLLVHSEHAPLAVHLPSLAQMTTEQFYEFCQANSELRIERTAQGEVIVMPPPFSDTGNRNSRINQQLTNWADEDGTGEVFGSNAGFTLPNGATRSPDASWIRSDRWNALSDQQKASFAPICPDCVVDGAHLSSKLSA
jgi:Uma2 family endonuclease